MIESTNIENHVAAELTRLHQEIEQLRAALKKITDIYVKAPGWANPEPTSKLVYAMYTTARDALEQNAEGKNDN